MKTKRSQGVLLGSVGIFLIIFVTIYLYVSSLSGDETRLAAFRTAQPTGKALKIFDLASDQRIEITHITVADRQNLAHTYIISGGEPGMLSVFERTLAYRKNWGAEAEDFGQAVSYKITQAQKRSIEAFLSIVRLHTETRSSYYDTYEIDYFSGDQKIGTEKLIDFTHFRDEYYNDSYDELPVGVRAVISLADWNDALSFHELLKSLKNEANQALVPTVMSVTPAADAPVAPATTAAHL